MLETMYQDDSCTEPYSDLTQPEICRSDSLCGKAGHWLCKTDSEEGVASHAADGFYYKDGLACTYRKWDDHSKFEQWCGGCN
jgi:hypothetical protein